MTTNINQNRPHLRRNYICTREISSSHGGEYDVQSCLLGYHFTRQYNPEDSSEHIPVPAERYMNFNILRPQCIGKI
jgi:hypothetical protein